jgi:hypothetical protein
VDAAIERRNLLRLRDDAAPLIQAMPEAAHPFGEYVLAELARMAARLDSIEDAQAAATRSREERLRLDPLRFIPSARLDDAMGEGPAPEFGPVAVAAGDPGFVGFGWWEPERTEQGSLVWSGTSRCASVLLPALGGGELVVTISVRSPFGLPLDIGEHDLFLDGAPLSFATVSNDGTIGIFEARATLPPMVAGGRVALLLIGPQHDDPARGARRDTRRIGIGLLWVRLERA